MKDPGNSISPAKNFQFLSGGGEMGMLMRSKDWSATSLGPPAKWPQSLRTTLSIVLNSKFPMFLFWGPQLICFYNDAYRPSLGENGKHPHILGMIGENAWVEIWDIIKPLIDQVLAGGEGTWSEDQLIPIFRNGRIEDVYWTFSYSPVNDESGGVAGVFVTCTETTDKIISFRKIEESEERFRNMAENSDILIAVGDETSNATYFNKAWVELTGRPMNDLLKFGWVDLVHPGDREGYVNVYLTAFEKKVSFTGQFRILNKKGEYRWLLANGPPRFRTDGSFAGYISSCVDITDLNTATEKISISEQRFQAAVAAVHGVLWTNNAEGKMEGEQAGWASLTGQSYQEYQGYGWAKAVHPEDAQPTVDAWNEAVKERKTFNFGHRVKTKEGSWGDFSIRAIPLLNGDGTLREWVGVHTDVTESKQAEKILKANEEKFRLLANSMPQHIWTADIEGNLNYFNQSVFNYSGLTLEQINKDGWLQIVHPDERGENIERWMHSIATGEDFLFEHRFRRHDGEYRWQLSRAIPQRDGTGKIQMWVGTSTDIQEMKEHEQQKDFFISMASHELKTPVTSIKGYVQLLQIMHANSDDAILKKSLGSVDRQVEKLTLLISDLLDLSKIKSGSLFLNKEHFLLNDLVQEVIQEIRHINPGYSILFSGDTKKEVFADRERIGQVLINLLTNAVKYSPETREIKVESYIENNNVVVSVEDSGIGINKKDQKKIFERFYRVEGKNEKTFPGFGIGLFISMEIIHRHDGEIAVKSEPGKGSVFYFSIPVESW